MLFGNGTLGVGVGKSLFDFGKPLALVLEAFLHLAQIVGERMQAGFEGSTLFVVGAPVVMGALVLECPLLIGNGTGSGIAHNSGSTRPNNGSGGRPGRGGAP